MVNPLIKYDRVLMPYFPRRQKFGTPTPTPDGGSDYDADYTQDDYTPFLIKLKPKDYKVTIYYKKPIFGVTEGSILEHKCKFVKKAIV